MNILLIHADEHRADCLGFCNKELKTPNIDSLAKDGETYTNHYCTFPVCTPSRYSLLTGKYSHEHLGFSNHCTPLPSIKSFVSVLKENKYRTKAIGKMHFTPTYLDMGFEEMILAEQDGPGRFEDDYHSYLAENQLIDDIDITDQRQEYRKNASEEYFKSFGAKESDLPLEHHSTTYIKNHALEEISTWENGENHFLMLGFIKPHHPFDPPYPYSTMYDPDALTLLDGYLDEVPKADYDRSHGYFDNADLDEKTLRKIMSLYYGTITQIDDSIGEIIRLMKQKGIYDDALIVYTSDHGDYMGFHHMMLKGNHLYDPLVKIPLIMKYPRSEHTGIVKTLSSNIDVADAVLSVAGIPSDFPKGIRGRQMVIAEDKCDGLNEYMVRSERFKLNVLGDLSNTRFYDLENDPFELNDLSADPQYAEEILNHKLFLSNEILFHSMPPLSLDENGKAVKDPEMIKERSLRLTEYFKTKSKNYHL